MAILPFPRAPITPGLPAFRLVAWTPLSDTFCVRFSRHGYALARQPVLRLRSAPAFSDGATVGMRIPPPRFSLAAVSGTIVPYDD